MSCSLFLRKSSMWLLYYWMCSSIGIIGCGWSSVWTTKIFPHQPTVGPNCANLKGHNDNNDTIIQLHTNITLRQHWLLLATFETKSSDNGSNKPLIFAVSIKLVTLLFLGEKERNHLWILSDSFHAKSSHLQLLTDSVHSAHILWPDARAETVPELRECGTWVEWVWVSVVPELSWGIY